MKSKLWVRCGVKLIRRDAKDFLYIAKSNGMLPETLVCLDKKGCQLEFLQVGPDLYAFVRKLC